MFEDCSRRDKDEGLAVRAAFAEDLFLRRVLVGVEGVDV